MRWRMGSQIVNPRVSQRRMLIESDSALSHKSWRTVATLDRGIRLVASNGANTAVDDVE